MGNGLGRREFLAASLAAGVDARAGEPLRIGLIGLGNRGTSLLSNLLAMPGLKFPALCDINPANLARAQQMIEKAGHPPPEGYTRGEGDFRRLVAREDLDAIVIATYWQWHTPMAVAGMQAGKYVAVEVPAALTVEECWQLVNTSERTGMPCMMLENWSFRRDNLAVLNMIREGLFGEVVHCHCAHSHNCIDHWFFDAKGNTRWSADFLLKRNADQYPTHSLGPVISWMDIHCGDAFAYITSTATRSLGINHFLAKKFGPDHPNAKRQYKQGDIVSSVVKTHKGNTVVINYDMQLPRPYDNRWMLQGTEGVYNESRNAVYLWERSPKYEEWESFDPYQEKFEHSWWKAMRQNPAQSHGGTDYLELSRFLEAVRSKTPTPIDVYDSAIMSVVIPLSEQSIAAGSAPVPFPDFTRGRWKTKKPTFAS